jgi:chromosome partitioning protein
MIVTVGNTKGGVGKSTLALQLALARKLAGHEVLLVDADIQGTAQTAATLRSEAAQSPSLTCVQLADWRQLRAQLAALAQKHDDTIIDAGGRDNEALRIALGYSDLVVVPVQPRAADVWELAKVADLIDRVQAAREADGDGLLRVLAVLNLADPALPPDTIETHKALAEFPQLGPTELVIRRRKAVANAMAHGLAVTELQPRDPKAVDEIGALVAYVFDSKEREDGDHKASKAHAS